MNRLLTRKKTRDDDGAGQDEPGQVSSTFPSPPRKKGWRWKKQKEEPEPEPEAKMTLPTADELRTSLIMPDLSTRFSMLKEQDDPLSLIGKASDDSVLNPKRRSRLGYMGYNVASLSDIAETSSLASSRDQVKLPFAGSLRTGSFCSDKVTGDDESTYPGSIMSRSRPGEGNVLFGGRQKVFRIPVGDSGSIKSLGTTETRGMKGRALYDDDVSMSTFQRLREQEKQEKLRLAQQTSTSQLEVEPAADLTNRDGLNSPSFSYNEKRETASSTTSGPSMMGFSTAPTSVAGSSPGLPPSAAFVPPVPSTLERTKSRKLYEQGLDQHIQEQQNAALNTITTLQRHVSLTGPHKSKSASNMHETFEKGAPTSSRNASPHMPSPTLPPSNSSSHRPSVDQSVLPPRSSTNNDRENQKKAALWECLDPIDRGMATAMGTFNRPKQFDEQQFLQRQRSLLQQQPKNRSNSSPVKPVSPSKRKPPPGPNGYEPRARAETAQGDHSWSPSKRKNEAKSFNVPRKPMRKPVPRLQKLDEPAQQPSPTAQSNGTFFASPDLREENGKGIARMAPLQTSSQSNDIASANFPIAPSHPPPPPPLFAHPAMRSVTSPYPQSNKEKRRAWSPDELKSGLAATDSIPKEFTDLPPEIQEPEEVQRPATAEANSDLKGLVREHLRHPSNSSSIYPAQTPGALQTEFQIRPTSMYSTFTPYEDNDETPIPPDEPENEYHYEHQRDYKPEYEYEHDFPAADRSGSSSEKASLQISNLEPTDWERELNRQHRRDVSSETTYERLAFASELAQRQRTIQENLKIKTSSPSPTSTAKNVFENSLKSFGMLRPKQSNDALPIGRDSPRPWTNESETRSSSKTRSIRETAGSPPLIGRTLHSRMPGGFDETYQEPTVEFSHLPRPSVDNPRIPRPSVEYIRPSIDVDHPRQSSNSTQHSHAVPTNSSPPASSRTSVSKQRSNSDASFIAPSADITEKRNPSLPRPSLENTRIRSESWSSKRSAPTSGPPKPYPIRAATTGLTKLSTSSPAMSSADLKDFGSYSAASTPPASGVSTPNLVNAPSTSTSINTEPPTTSREQNIPSTGFFFPPNNEKPVPRELPRNRAMQRKNTINKDDISEPKLIASTSVVDTVDLPPGASLQNGLRDDFDVVLLGSSGSAPAPTIPTGDKPRKAGFLANFSRREKGDRDEMLRRPEDEPEPRRFKIKRMEMDEGNGLKPLHRALMAREFEETTVASTF